MVLLQLQYGSVSPQIVLVAMQCTKGCAHSTRTKASHSGSHKKVCGLIYSYMNNPSVFFFVLINVLL
jgi:hypothetical protein